MRGRGGGGRGGGGGGGGGGLKGPPAQPSLETKKHHFINTLSYLCVSTRMRVETFYVIDAIQKQH